MDLSEWLRMHSTARTLTAGRRGGIGHHFVQDGDIQPASRAATTGFTTVIGNQSFDCDFPRQALPEVLKVASEFTDSFHVAA
jgi:hypothetical protein